MTGGGKIPCPDAPEITAARDDREGKADHDPLERSCATRHGQMQRAAGQAGPPSQRGADERPRSSSGTALSLAIAKASRQIVGRPSLEIVAAAVGGARAVVKPRADRARAHGRR